MIKFITVWILTVTYSNTYNGDRSGYGAGYSYQLQYASQKTCLQQLEKHKSITVPAKSWSDETKHIRPHRHVRCDFAQVPVYAGK